MLSDKLTAIVDTMAVVRESHPCGSELVRDVGGGRENGDDM